MSKPSATNRNATSGGADKAQDKRALNRRGFFTMGGSAVAAAAIVPFTGEAEAAAESVSDAKKARYKETDHVKNYYRVNRY